MATLTHSLLIGSVGPLWRLFRRIKTEGAYRIPPGGAVLAFNHPRAMDPPHIAAAYGKPLHFLGKKEVFEIPVLGWFIRDVGGQIPLDRSKGGNTAAFEEAVSLLRGGAKIAIAPEGTTEIDGVLGRGRTGAVRMALAAGVPVVPVAVKHHAWPGPSVISFGTPIDIDLTPDADRDALQEATDQVLSAIAGLLGVRYDPATAPDHAAAKGLRGRATEHVADAEE